MTSTTTYQHAPLGAGGQQIKLDIAADGTIWGCADIHSSYRLAPGADSFEYMFNDAKIPAGIKSADHMRVGFPGATYNDSTGCFDARQCRSDSTKAMMIYDGQVIYSTNSGGLFNVTNIPRSKFQSNDHDQKGWSGHNISYGGNGNVALVGTNGHDVYWTTTGPTGFAALGVAAGNLSPGGYDAPHWTAYDPSSSVVSGVHQRWFYTRYGFGIWKSEAGPGGPYTLMGGTGAPGNGTVSGNLTSFYVDTFGTLWTTILGEVGIIRNWTSGGGWSTAIVPGAPVGGGSYAYSRIAVSPQNQNHMMVAGNTGTYFHTKDRVNWVRWTDDLNNNPINEIHRERAVKYLDIPSTPIAPQQYNVEPNMMQFDPNVADRLWVASWIGIHYVDIPASGGGGTNPLNWVGVTKGIEMAVMQTAHVTDAGKAFFGSWDLGTYRYDDEARPMNPQVCGYKPGDTMNAGLKHPFMVQHTVSIDSAMDDPNYVVMLEHGGWDATRINNPHVSVTRDGGNTVVPFAVDPPRKPFCNGGGNVAVGAAGNVVIIWPDNALGVYTLDDGHTWHDLNILGIIDGDNGFDYSGAGGYFINRVSITHDKLGYFYIFTYGSSQTPNPVGIWRSPTGAVWTKMHAGSPTAFGGDFAGLTPTHIRAIPRRSGHLFMTNGNGGTSFTGKLIRSTDFGVTLSAALATNGGQAITNVADVAFSKNPVQGATIPAIHMWGAVNSVFGHWRSDDDLATSVLQSTAMAGSMDGPMQLFGDPTRCRCYFAMTGNGIIQGDFAWPMAMAA